MWKLSHLVFLSKGIFTLFTALFLHILNISRSKLGFGSE
jgi:hypothetical protein